MEANSIGREKAVLTTLPRLTFPRSEHLKKRADISRVFKKGRCVSAPVSGGGYGGLKLFFLRNDTGANRVAFTFARKFGCAAERNSARRLSRESYRHLRQTLKGGYDLVLLVYPQDKDKLREADRRRQLQAVFTRAGLLLQ